MTEVNREPITSVANFKEFKVVENPELGVAYKDQVIELPQHRQDETGITRLRIRRVTKLPEEVEKKLGWLDGYKNQPRSRRFYNFFQTTNGIKSDHDLYSAETIYKDQLLFLTNGRFPSPLTWSHQFMGDWSVPSSYFRGYSDGNSYDWIINLMRDSLMRFTKQELFFQEISPKSLIDKYSESEIKMGKEFGFGEDHIYKDLPKLMANPFRFFQRLPEGNLEEVKVREDGNKIMELIESGEPWLYLMSVWKGQESYSSKLWLGDSPLFVFGNQNPAFTDYMSNLLENDEAREMMEKRSFRSFSKETDHLKQLLKGEDIGEVNGAHPVLPIAGNVGLPPFRWSHAE